jgi:hypothetical protein
VQAAEKALLEHFVDVQPTLLKVRAALTGRGVPSNGASTVSELSQILACESSVG